LFFNNSLYVSSGEDQDSIDVEILMPEFFVSKNGFQSLKGDLKIESVVPAQAASIEEANLMISLAAST